MLDQKTQALDQEFFEYLLDLEVRKAVRYLYFFSLLVIEPDSGKENKGSTQPFDESILATLANLVRDEIRDTDLIGRVGRAKFFLILHHADFQNTWQIGERIKDRIQDYTFSVRDMDEKHTVSIGGVSFPTHANEIESLVAKAEVMLDKAKGEGGNFISFPQE